MTTIAFIGAGNMAGAIIGGLINNGSDSQSIWACDPGQEKLTQLKNDFNIQTSVNNLDAISVADVIILAVKPQVMETVLAHFNQNFKKENPSLFLWRQALT